MAKGNRCTIELAARSSLPALFRRRTEIHPVTSSHWHALIGFLGLGSLFAFVAFGTGTMIVDGWARFDFLPVAIANHLARYVPFYAILTCLAGWLLYLLDASTNPLVPSEKRGQWVAVLFFGGFVVMPFYFWWYIRPHFTKPRRHDEAAE
jgi:hypothetical protein